MNIEMATLIENNPDVIPDVEPGEVSILSKVASGRTMTFPFGDMAHATVAHPSDGRMHRVTSIREIGPNRFEVVTDPNHSDAGIFETHGAAFFRPYHLVPIDEI